MPKSYNELFEEVMQLPAKSRLHFGHDVIASVVYDDVPACALLSDEEIVRRAGEVRSGKAKLVDGFGALERLRSEFRTDAAKAA